MRRKRQGNGRGRLQHAFRNCLVTTLEALESRRLLAASGLPSVVGANDELTFQNFILSNQTVTDNAGGFLTGKSNADPSTIALAYLHGHARDMGLLPGDVDSAIVTDHYSDTLTGITHVYLDQTYNGLPVLDADMNADVMPDGRLISITGAFIPGLSKQAAGAPAVSDMTPSDALQIAAQQLDLDPGATQQVTGKALGLAETTSISAPDLSLDPIPAQLRYVPTSATTVELSWNLVLRTTDQNHWYNVAVGQSQSRINFANDWTDNASYNVIPRPNESPQDGGFAVLTDPQDPTASPFGWHDTNGVAGPEFTDTRGNNVDAHLDSNGDNVPDGTRPTGGASLDFSGYTQAPASAPTVAQNQNIAQVDLFYANNTAHDIHYKYGFNEAAGNFQTNNYGHGGVGNDAVQADAQDGSGTNNANFSTPPDGQPGRMQMYLFTLTSPSRDGDLDNSVMFHEYGHGVSNRLTGGPANSDALSALQSSGMGEGWSDWWSLMFLQRSTDTQNAAYPIGNYVLGQAQTAVGIRRFPYSFNMATDPLTVDAFGGSGSGGGTTRALEVHDTGEIWCSALWDMTWELVNKYGFDPNIQNGFNPASPKGNTLALQLVMDALKLQPANPSFKDARDAILQADVNLHNTLGTPLNQTEIWAAFARRGMGTGFVDSAAYADSVTLSTSVPVADPTVTSTLPATTISPFSTIDFHFDQPMDTTSFSIASDVVSFTGTANENLLASISGFSWPNPETLRLSLTSTFTQRGTYTLVIGPQIVAADDGHGMDTNRNGIPGENPGDRYSATITLSNTFGADSFGYKAAQQPFENLNLVIGGSGVITLVNGSDDGSGAINLGANTFNFYGTTYTGSASLFACVNGQISFGSAANPNNSYFNDDLTDNDGTAPTPLIAAWWGDFLTNANVTGATDSAVLYQIDVPNNRLIVEWSDMASYYGSGATTFQAILQLNTGATPGRIILNYPDMDMSGFGSNGGVGTFGVKASGLQGVNRLLVNLNFDQHPWISSNQAIVIGTDVTAPKVTNEAFNYLASQQLSFTFSEDVGASLAVGDFTLTNLTTSTVISNANLQLNYNAGTKTATLTDMNGLLSNGNYALTINSAGVTDPPGNPLDGDGDGVIGGNHTFNFFVLNGDADHNGKVNALDFNAVASNFGGSGKNYAQGDFDYNGTVNTTDFTILATNFNKTPPAFGPVVAASVAGASVAGASVAGQTTVQAVSAASTLRQSLSSFVELSPPTRDLAGLFSDSSIQNLV